MGSRKFIKTSKKVVKSMADYLLAPKRQQKQLLQWASTISSDTYNQQCIVADYKSLFELKGLTTDEYYEFEFEKRDEEFRHSFLGLNEQRFYLDYLNPMRYYSLARNKYLAHKILENTGVKKSMLYCYYMPEARYIKSNDLASDIIGVVSVLKQKNAQSCVIKTTESSHGDNVWVIKAIKYQENDAEMIRFDDKTIKLSEVLGKDPLIFESVVKQTKQFAAFNESSVNTVRFMTTLWPDGSARIIATFIKIGRAGRCVDNAGGGGNVDVCVDTESGEIKYAIQYDGWRNIKDIEKHPDNGNQLNGVVINNWEAIKSEVIKFQQAFPYCKAAGWDIAITDEGPVIIEVNDFWDRTGQYFIRKGWRSEIRECYIAWRKYWGGGKSLCNREFEASINGQRNDRQIFLIPEGEEYQMFRQPNSLKLEHLKRIAAHE